MFVVALHALDGQQFPVQRDTMACAEADIIQVDIGEMPVRPIGLIAGANCRGRVLGGSGDEAV